jgi:hypothetical protein
MNMDRISRFASLIGIAAALAWIAAVAALAQTRTPLSPETPSHQTVPQAGGSGSSTEPLSNKLDHSGGVIRPPANIDSGLMKSPPKAGSGSMVIRPPGTRSGNSETNPK